MRPIKTLNDALKAIDRGLIVDAAENRVPWKVVEALSSGANGNNYHAHIRYEGSREIWWFCK